MATKIMLVPAGESAGLTTVSLGLVRALQQQGLSVQFFKPVAQDRGSAKTEEQSTAIVRNIFKLDPATPINPGVAEELISQDKMDILLEDILAKFEEYHDNEEIVIIEGLVADSRQPYTVRLNRAICNALDARLVLVMNPGSRQKAQINEQLEIIADNYGGHKSQKLLGCIFNKINAPLDEEGHIRLNLAEPYNEEKRQKSLRQLKHTGIFDKNFSYLGSVTWNADAASPRVLDLVRHLNANLLTENCAHLERRISSIHFCAREIHNLMPVLKPGALLIISADRSDAIVTACLATLNGTQLGAILLTGQFEPDANIMALCHQAFATGLPVLQIGSSTWETALKLQYFNREVAIDDNQRLDDVMNHTASCIEEKWLKSLSKGAEKSMRLSPPAFKFKLTQFARKAKKTIVLPEGEEPRTIAAASICAERGIAKCVLLGDKEEIARSAEQQGINLHKNLVIENPAAIQQKYVPGLIKLRSHKGMTEIIAREQLRDNNVLGTMMLQQGDVDGLVSGAVNTTANTIRPALQLVKTAPDATLVSSVFFMLLPEQVLVYGDCAINPDPNAEQLADIAIQSADSARAFDIDPKVAMISYSTGSSGSGSDVDKVREATKIAQAKRPDLLIDGPLQYDAAIMENVARKKAPDSPVAGQATVFIFPDLNTGNTTYKAVQRSADLISIGPMLQGLQKPVNDLSRGALVDDIVFTIALTAIQATQK